MHSQLPLLLQQLLLLRLLLLLPEPWLTLLFFAAVAFRSKVFLTSLSIGSEEVGAILIALATAEANLRASASCDVGGSVPSASDSGAMLDGVDADAGTDADTDAVSCPNCVSKETCECDFECFCDVGMNEAASEFRR